MKTKKREQMQTLNGYKQKRFIFVNKSQLLKYFSLIWTAQRRTLSLLN